MVVYNYVMFYIKKHTKLCRSFRYDRMSLCSLIDCDMCICIDNVLLLL